MRKLQEEVTTVADKFQRSVLEIDTIFNSYKQLYDIYDSSFKSLRDQLEGLPANYLTKIDNAEKAFARTVDTVNTRQGLISSQLYSQGLVLLVGYSESLLREVFRDLFRSNLRSLGSVSGLTFTLDDIKKARNDSELGDILLDKLEENKNPAEKLNFQNMKQLQGIMKGYFGIEITDESAGRLHEYWQIRHVVIHNASIIDERFVSNLSAASIDTNKYKIGEQVTVSKSEYEQCFGLLTILFESIDNEISRLKLVYGS